jgi:hypothetical protein
MYFEEHDKKSQGSKAIVITNSLNSFLYDKTHSYLFIK